MSDRHLKNHCSLQPSHRFTVRSIKPSRQDSFHCLGCPALRCESDERKPAFPMTIHALIVYRKPGEDSRANLADFLKHVGVTVFEQSNVRVGVGQRLTSLSYPQHPKSLFGLAVALQNKIEAF